MSWLYTYKITSDYLRIEVNSVSLYSRDVSGFTGHEHLYAFNLINMNGRNGVYPEWLCYFGNSVVSRMLSPDNYIQAPDFSQSFNRYSYAWNNPLVLTDPDGEWVHLVIGAAIGGFTNWAFNGFEFNLKGLGYFGVGALAGALGAGVGAGISSMLPVAGTASGGGFAAGFIGTASISSTGFVAGTISGAAAGFTNGLVLGTGNSLINKEKIVPALVEGLKQAINQGVIGAISGGVLGGIDAKLNGRNFWTGSIKQDIVGNNYWAISEADYYRGDNKTKDYFDTFIPENPDPFSVKIEVKGMKKITNATWRPDSNQPFTEHTIKGNEIVIDFPAGNDNAGFYSVRGWRWSHSGRHYGKLLPKGYIYSRVTDNEYGGVFFLLNFLKE